MLKKQKQVSSQAHHEHQASFAALKRENKQKKSKS